MFDEESASDSEDDLPVSKPKASHKRQERKKDKPPAKKAKEAALEDSEDDVEIGASCRRVT